MKARRLLPALRGERALEDVLKGLLLVGVVVYPAFVSNPFNLDLMSTALVLGIFAMSVDLLWGYTGIINLGPAAALGLGAYTWALFLNHFHAFSGTYLALLLAMALPALLAMVISYVSLRAGARGIYFALISLAVALMLGQIAQAWYSFTGGSNGVINVPFPDVGIPGVFRYSLADPLAFYYFVAGVTAIVLVVCSFLVRSPFGQVLRAIRDSPLRAETLGYSTIKYRVVISMCSAALGGLAGALYAPVAGIVYPDLFGVAISIQVFVWIAIGGQGTLIGPLLGAVAISLGESYLSGALVSYYLIAIGGAFVVVVLLFPGGLVGALRQALDALSRSRRRHPIPPMGVAGRESA